MSGHRWSSKPRGMEADGGLGKGGYANARRAGTAHRPAEHRERKG